MYGKSGSERVMCRALRPSADLACVVFWLVVRRRDFGGPAGSVRSDVRVEIVFRARTW